MSGKFCPVCMRPHQERGDACSPECGRRLRNHKAAVSSGRSRALARIHRRQLQARAEAERWRDIAMGRNRGERLKEIFGFNPEQPNDESEKP